MKMKRLLTYVPLFLLPFNAVAKQSVTVSYISLDGGAPVTKNPIETYDQPADIEESKSIVRLYPEIEFQTMTGIGGCFNEIGGEALASLDKDAQRDVLEALFTDEGISFTHCRAAIGASDFGIDAYSFSEVANDFKMKHFSLSREKKYMLPYIQSAFKINPELRLFGSPWSPPGWMKESMCMDRGNEFRELNYLKDDPKVYESYALYLLKYVEGYRKAGVKVDRIVVQNEQDWSTKYPSCRMPVEQMSKFVTGYMRPLFDKMGVDTQIWAGTFRTHGEREALKLLSSEEYRKGFDGVGVQYMTPQYLSDVRSVADGMPIMHTESVCFNGANSQAQANSRFNEIANYINQGSENFCYWNMILNETGKSGWDWRQNALITIDRESGSVTYNPDYAVMAIMSRMIRPGDVRIASFSSSTSITLDAGDKYVLLIQNDLDKPRCYTCYVGDETYNVEIPSKSLSAIEIKK